MAAPTDLTALEKKPALPLRERLSRLIARLRALRPPRRIRPTREGYGFMLLTLGVGFAALNTGNNLLYLVLGMMLSLIGVSGLLSEQSVQRIAVSRRFPAEIVVGQEAVVSLTVHNRKKRVPAIAIWVEERYQRNLEADACFVVYTRAREESTVKGVYRFTRRGKHRLTGIFISTTYPFGLFRRSYKHSVEDEVLVYPRIEAVTPNRGGFKSHHGEAPVQRKGQGEEFLGLKPYVQGDDPRLIHWKTSARRSRLFLRENAAQHRRRLLIKLELANPLPEDSAYEQGLVQVVSYAAYFLERDYLVAIDVPAGAVPFDAGPLQLKRILRTVALSPRAGEAAEQASSSVLWPAGGQVVVRVTGQRFTVEENL